MGTYRVEHVTEYRYAAAATSSLNQAHLTPRNGPYQVCLTSRLKIEPTPSVSTIRPDFYDNTVTFFSVQEPHGSLRISVSSLVEVSRRPFPPPPSTAPWERARRLLLMEASPGSMAARQFVFESEMVPVRPDLAAYAARSFPPGRPILEAIIDLTERIRAEFTYDPRATSIATPVAEVLALRRGVCQDFAHLMIGCLRSLGLAARYVSGYVLTRPPPGGRRLVGADASHAWVSVWVPGFGWIDADPTNAVLPSTEHITLAWGRDYADVSPLRGIVLGGGAQSLSVSVDVTPAPA